MHRHEIEENRLAYHRPHGKPMLIWIAGHIDTPVRGCLTHGELQIPGVGTIPDRDVLRSCRLPVDRSKSAVAAGWSLD